MMVFALKYCKPIDTITADKTLKKLRKFELDDEEWGIISELVTVLHVRSFLYDRDIFLMTGNLLPFVEIQNCHVVLLSRLNLCCFCHPSYGHAL
jgi:hypothetical protein